MENKVCRTCLESSSLSPIFSNPEDFYRYSTAIYVTTGVKVTPNDGLPQHMCTNCITFLNKSLQFREKCQDTETYLLKMKNNFECVVLDKEGINKGVTETKVTEHIEIVTHDTDKIIYELKNEDLEVTKEKIESIGFNVEIKREYLELHEDANKPLIDCQNESGSNVISNSVFIVQEESQESIDIKNEVNEESEIIIPTAPPRRVSCQFCSKELSIRSLNEHIAQQHPGADDRRVKCALCDKYIVRAKMGRHRKMRHGNGDSFKCGYCKTEYDSKELLAEHVPTCGAKKPRRGVDSVKKLAECHICHKTMLKASLRPHVALKHEGKGPVCEHCGRRFANNLRLSEHRRARHSQHGHDKFGCSQCGYRSASRQTMQNHERLHRGEKPFVCETCGSGFHSLHLLRQHRQSHRTEKLIKCDQCPASFKANNSLHVHKMTCHSRAAYRCSLCARAFSCRHYAARHARHVHGVPQPASVVERVDDTEVEG